MPAYEVSREQMLFIAGMFLLAVAALAIDYLVEEWLARKRWERVHLTVSDLGEIQETVKNIHQYVDDLVDIGWTAVALAPYKYKNNMRTDVHMEVNGVQEHTRNIRLMQNPEKVDAMLGVYSKEWDETSSLLLPELRKFYEWCGKNVEKTMQAGGRGEAVNFVESRMSRMKREGSDDE